VRELQGKGMGNYFREYKLADCLMGTPASTPHMSVFGQGILSTGIDIIDLGIVPTPVNYYSMYTLPVEGAIQITGSHNPANMNGFKISHEQKAVFGDQIQYIKSIIEKGEFARGSGKMSEKELLEEYKQMIISKVKLARPLKIAMDCGNGAGSLTGPEIFREIGCDVTELYCNVDGRFPNHHPDPTVTKNLKDLIAEVQKGGYDFGVAFDGDADRIGGVDDKGQIIWADYLMILFLEEVARRAFR
jgi:phosphomannomutase/phosphoglucomutase